MPIIDGDTYSAASTTKLTGEEFVLKYPPFGRNKLRSPRRSSRMLRPRKSHQSPWVNDSNRVFKIGDVYDQQLARNRLQYGKEVCNIPNNNLKTRHRDLKIGRKPPRKESVQERTMHEIENYCGKSSLHGLRYVGDPSLSFGERMFWLVAFASALGFAAYYIQNIFEKWNTSPVIISFSPFDVPLNEIPFPAITICNMNQAKKIEARRILKEGSEIEKRLLNDYCTDNITFTTDEHAPTWNTLQDFLVKVGESCSDMLKMCFWRNKKVSCDDFFNNDLTDEGLCCSFNRLPPKFIFRNPENIADLNQTYSRTVDDWNPQDGFKDSPFYSEDVTPRRPSGTGTHLGLTLVLDTHVDDYFCSSTNSAGFKVMMLTNPIETPKMADFGFLIGPGTETRYMIRPDIKEATEALRSVDMEKRRCYFLNEKPLYYFRSYTSRNCGLECQANHTWKSCRCVPYYLPRNKETNVCGKNDEICSIKAKEDMELTTGNGTSCDCWPGCFELSYDKSSTVSPLSSTVKLRLEVENVTQAYYSKNMAITHFYFRKSQFRKQVKSELYGFTEVLSNVGGLLGLCLGFSFLSLIELFYHLTLRLFCGYVQKKRKIGKLRNGRDIPFMK